MLGPNITEIIVRAMFYKQILTDIAYPLVYVSLSLNKRLKF